MGSGNWEEKTSLNLMINNILQFKFKNFFVYNFLACPSGVKVDPKHEIDDGVVVIFNARIAGQFELQTFSSSP